MNDLLGLGLMGLLGNGGGMGGYGMDQMGMGGAMGGGMPQMGMGGSMGGMFGGLGGAAMGGMPMGGMSMGSNLLEMFFLRKQREEEMKQRQEMFDKYLEMMKNRQIRHAPLETPVAPQAPIPLYRF
jgi:hypothetical protein